MCPDLRQPFWTILLKIHLNSKPSPPRRRNFCSGKKNNFVGEGWWWRTWSAVIIELFKCRNFHRGSREGNSPAVKSSGKSINRVHRSAFVELFFSSSFFHLWDFFLYFLFETYRIILQTIPLNHFSSYWTANVDKNDWKQQKHFHSWCKKTLKRSFYLSDIPH